MRVMQVYFSFSFFSFLSETNVARVCGDHSDNTRPILENIGPALEQSDWIISDIGPLTTLFV